MTLDLEITVTVAVAALGVAGLMIVLERRGATPGRPLPIPTTPVLFLAVLVLILALAHLMTLLTGSPHQGRLG